MEKTTSHINEYNVFVHYNLWLYVGTVKAKNALLKDIGFVNILFEKNKKDIIFSKS